MFKLRFFFFSKRRIVLLNGCWEITMETQFFSFAGIKKEYYIDNFVKENWCQTFSDVFEDNP